MKTTFHLSIVILLCHSFVAPAQDIDRSKPPKPGPAPTINIADAASFVLPNGLKVFVVPNQKLPQVSATLTIDRDPLAEGKKAGMTGMAGQLMRRGTKKMKKEQLDEAVDFLGGSLSTSATSVFASSLKKNFPQLMAIMADVALRPAFDSAELEKVRTQRLSGLAQAKEDPNTIAYNVSSALTYGLSHPYGEIETEETVKNIRVADVRRYYNTYWKPNIAYLIFVGDITVAEARQLTQLHFGNWPKGVVPKAAIPVVKPPAKTYIALVDRPSSVQSVINISAPVQLKPGSPDAIKASVMSSILGGGFSSRLNQNLREKYGFTYGAGGGVSTDRLVGRFRASASVRNEKTDSAIGQFIHEFNRIRNEQASDSEVTALKNYMSGDFARSLEEPSTIAGFALNIARYNLPKDYYRQYLTRLSAVNAADVQKMAGTYVPVNNAIITIVGNAREIAPGLEKYGEVKYFDLFGNQTAAPVVKEVNADMDASQILKQAIEASGGEKALSEIKDLTLLGKVTFMGRDLDFEQKHLLPGNYSNSIKMGTMELMGQSKVGDAYKVGMQGASQEINDTIRQELNAKAAVIEERYYLSEPAYKFQVKGIESLDGKEVYRVLVTSPLGSSITILYDTQSGMRLQDIREQDAGPMGKVTITTTYLEYKEYNGLKVPVKIQVDAGPIEQEINISEVKVNTGLKTEDF